MPELDDVFAIAKQLSCHDRWLLAHMLWDSLPPEEEWEVGKPSKEDIAELDRKAADVDAGRVETIPGEVVKKLLRDKIAEYNNRRGLRSGSQPDELSN